MLRQPLIRWLAVVLLSVCLLTGCTLVDRLSERLYPSTAMPEEAPTQVAVEPPVEEPTSTPPLTDTPTPPALTATPPPEPPPTATPEPERNQQLVYARGGIIYRGDYFGREAVEAASVPQLEAYDFSQGMLGIARGRSLEIIDLLRGSLFGVQIPSEGEVGYAQVLWGSSGESLLYAAMVRSEGEEQAPDPLAGRYVDLKALTQDGALLGRARLEGVAGVDLLHYDDARLVALLIPFGADGQFRHAEYYDLQAGELLRRMEIMGEGEVAISTDGRYLLTESLEEGKARLNLYDLEAGPDARLATYAHPEGTHSVSHIWSPDGRYVAYLLQQGSSYQETAGLGVWVLDVASLEAFQVMEEPSLSSALQTWTPDGAYIVGHHRGEEGDTYYYAIRPDGGDRRILDIGADARILGWMAPVGESVPRVVVDAWHVLFLDAEREPQIMADVVAQYVASSRELDDEALSEQLTSYLQSAGWPTELLAPQLKHLSEDLVVAQLPTFTIYALGQGSAQALVNADLMLDARLSGNELGLIFGYIGASAVQPAFILFRQAEDGNWKPIWTPQGRRDWVSTDGEILFAGEGLGKLTVRGSSFGLDMGEDEVFAECGACPHAWLSATWVRDGDGYVRQTDLPVDAPLSDAYWEMTERKPYAVLREVLRRLRKGLTVGDLASEAAVSQATALGLLDSDLRLLAEEETEDTVTFSDLEGGSRFSAMVLGGRLVRVEKLGG
ncbi:MAG: hypothetical protein FJZ90_15030 [Chloroflexi bacterium]|nr:hypothetical protein [Chloroflexota bacterium]